MKWIIRENRISQNTLYNAGSKAKNDIDFILTEIGYKPLPYIGNERESKGIISKSLDHLSRYRSWEKTMERLNENDIIVIQYPIKNHTVFFSCLMKKLRKKSIKAIGIIHDIESLRLAISDNSSVLTKLRYRIEELSALRFFDKIIVHNQHMRKAIHDFFCIPMDKMINLEIFDYLYKPANDVVHAVYEGAVIIAGNLDKKKSGYIYNLPDSIMFKLYGANYDETSKQKDNIQYKGKVKPDDLPGVLKGSYGLIWDGPSIETCAGVYGEYLKYNNPHKASLYIASGLPIITWSGSALASFIEAKGIGLTIENINSIPERTKKITNAEYNEMKNNVDQLGEKIRNGDFLKAAINIALKG